MRGSKTKRDGSRKRSTVEVLKSALHCHDIVSFNHRLIRLTWTSADRRSRQRGRSLQSFARRGQTANALIQSARLQTYASLLSGRAPIHVVRAARRWSIRERQKRRRRSGASSCWPWRLLGRKSKRRRQWRPHSFLICPWHTSIRTYHKSRGTRNIWCPCKQSSERRARAAQRWLYCGGVQQCCDGPCYGQVRIYLTLNFDHLEFNSIAG